MLRSSEDTGEDRKKIFKKWIKKKKKIKLFYNSLFRDYQENMFEKMKDSDFVFDYIDNYTIVVKK